MEYIKPEVVGMKLRVSSQVGFSAHNMLEDNYSFWQSEERPFHSVEITTPHLMLLRGYVFEFHPSFLPKTVEFHEINPHDGKPGPAIVFNPDVTKNLQFFFFENALHTKRILFHLRDSTQEKGQVIVYRLLLMERNTPGSQHFHCKVDEAVREKLALAAAEKNKKKNEAGSSSSKPDLTSSPYSMQPNKYKLPFGYSKNGEYVYTLPPVMSPPNEEDEDEDEDEATQ